MTKFKKEKVSFFKKELWLDCACARGDDSPWLMPPPPPRPNPPPLPKPF
ncbi:MAG: hypothetical protein LBS38_02560 [Endomicrobium sp.]|jgi:hypothetical protein|nr:hypothetical protein [Endomicrobium sp.]